MEKDLKWIKKHYGEKMMHLCRTHLYQLFETSGLVPKLLDEHFHKNRELADDIIAEGGIFEFVNYMMSFVEEKGKQEIYEKKSAKELMDEAGYILFDECLTEGEIQAFRRFYREDELICTIKNGGRLRTARVWFAIKKNVADIKREDFKNPHRQDEYGTSVISIQFSRDSDTLSIKNRYNHTVINCDNTFNSNLDNIIPGLSLAFERDYGVKDEIHRASQFELKNYVNVGGKFYKYNHESGNIYYCADNVVIDRFRVIKLPEHQMLVEGYVFDFKENKVFCYDETEKDSFPESLGEIEKMSFNGKEIVVKVKNGKDVIIGIDKQRRITSIKNENVTYVDSFFLENNTHLQSLEMPNLEECENYFLYNNTELTELNLPSLKRCGDSFICSNSKIKKVNLPSLETCGISVLNGNLELTEISLPSLRKITGLFLAKNEKISKVNLPLLEDCGFGFLRNNKELKEISLPSLKYCGPGFILENTGIVKADFPKLGMCADGFFDHNKELTELSLPSLVRCGSNFLLKSRVKKLDLPLLEACGNSFLGNNCEIEELSLPSLLTCGLYFLSNNSKLKKVDLPKLEECGNNFLYCAKELTEISFPKLRKCRDEFISSNRKISKVYFPVLEECGDEFLRDNVNLTEICLPALKTCGAYFINNGDSKLKKVDLPAIKTLGWEFLAKNKELTEINMPALEQYRNGCLANCVSLEKINIPKDSEFWYMYKMLLRKYSKMTNEVVDDDGTDDQDDSDSDDETDL